MNGAFSLKEMMNKNSSKTIKEVLSTFKCTAEPELERFLKQTARMHDSKDVSRTFLVISDDIVMGFFTLATKCLAVGDPNALAGRIGEGMYGSMNIKDGIAQSFLIGQLARADNAEKGFGRSMVTNAIMIFEWIKEHIGCRLVRLDCRDSLIPYYAGIGFIHIGKNRDATLNLMAILI